MSIDLTRATKFWLPTAEILLGGAALALLTLVGLWLDLNLGTASLIYVIVIVLVSLRGNLIPAVVLSIIAAGCLDYFFTVPHFSLEIDTPQDTVAVAPLQRPLWSSPVS
jgi:K+-sensing histidine kinase KdpD